jgi:hypothetical protein
MLGLGGVMNRSLDGLGNVGGRMDRAGGRHQGWVYAQDWTGADPERRAGLGSDDAVDHQVVACLEGLDGTERDRAEVAIGTHAKPLLDLAHGQGRRLQRR